MRATQAAGLFREPQRGGSAPPAFRREVLLLDFPGFPERTENSPCLAPTPAG